MREVCEQQQALPMASAIAPMAEIQLAPWGVAAGPVLQILREIDRSIEGRD